MPHGRIVNVVERGYGSRLVGDLAAGATVVPVDDVFLFNEAEDDSGDPIGELQIGEETYEYIRTDDDENTITLVSATTEDYEDQDWVYLAPATTEKYGIVELDGGGSTEFLIPFLLWAWVEEQTRGSLVGEWVRLSWDGQQYVFENLLGVPKKLNGAVIDPASTIPPGALTDGKPPAGSPAPVLEAFAVGGLRWSVTPVANADPVRFRVYADTVDPPTQDAAHLVSDTASLSGTFAAIDGVRLLPDDPTATPNPVYVACVEYDADGDAALSATSAPATPRRASVPEISADWVYAGSIEANQIASGSVLTQLLNVGDYIEIDGANSFITIFGDTAHTQPLVQLRPDGSIFRGQVIADDVSVLNGLVLQGLLSHIAQNAGVTLDSSIADPGTAPTLTVGASPAAWPALPAGYGARGMCWDGTQWLRLIRKSDTTTKVELINTSGVVTSTVTLGSTSTSLDANSIVKVGTNWFVMLQFPADERYSWQVAKYTTAGSRVAVGPLITDSGAGERHAVGTDGTNLLVAYREGVEVVDISTLDLAGTFYSFLFDEDTFSYVGRGNFDFGADRVVVASGSTVHVFSVSGSTLTELTAKTFGLVDNSYYGGFCWDGSNFFSSRTILNKYNGYYPAASENAYVAHRDNNGSDHTKVSPIAAVALKKRQYVQAALAPAPSGAATPSVWMKLGTSTPAATALLASSETITTRNVLLNPAVAGGSALTTDTNTFGSGTAGWIKSQLGGLELYGDGVAKIPGLLRSSSRGRRNTTQSIATSGSQAKVQFDQFTGTALPSADLTYSAGVFTVVRAGLFTINAYAIFAANATGARRLHILINGALLEQKIETALTIDHPLAVVITDLPLSAGDTIEMDVTQSSGGALNLQVGSFMNISRSGVMLP